MYEQIIRQRLWNQQLTKPVYKTPAEVVRWFSAVQAQDLLGSLYAVGRRMAPGATESTVEQAIADKTIVRSWPMRGTIHFVPPEDLRWMTALLAPRLDAKVAGNYRRAELTPQEVARAGEVLASILRGAQLTRAELYAALNRAGIETDGRNGEQRGMHLLVHWARHGLLCIAPRRGKQPTFALLEEWLPASRELAGDVAIIELGKRYFASHGPATVKDFMWWTGLNAGEVKPNLPHITKELEKVVVDGTEYWLLPGQSSPLAPPDVVLLPNFDEYTIAYVDRSAVLDPALRAKLGYGLAPNILIDGRVAGTWRRTLKKDHVTIEANVLHPLSAAQNLALQKAADQYGVFVGCSTVTLDLG